MTNEASKRTNDAVLSALDHLIAGATWDENNFFRVMGNKLRAMRDDFSSTVTSVSHLQSKMDAYLVNRVALRSGQREVFIGLYASDGGNLQAWERILSNLSGQILSRPIYADEASAQAMINAKSGKVNEAYVALYVNENAILTPNIDKVPVDKLGQSLLTLKDNAISLDNIHYFVHLQHRYQYTKGRLLASTIN